jgi:hypothetical protein
MRICFSPIILAALAGVVFSGMSYAQPPDVLWTYTYPGTCEWAGSEAVMQPGDGCTAFGTIVYGMYSINTLVVRLDSTGNELWSTGYQGGFSDAAPTDDGGYIIAATYMPVHGSEARFYRLSADGSLVWYKLLGGEFGGGSSADQTPDGGFILCGQEYNDGTLWRTDADGNIQWTKTWLEVHFTDILALQDGCFLIAGRTAEKGEALLMKTDSLGTELWSLTYSGCSNACSLIDTADGGYAFIGQTDHFLLIKVGPAGEEQWRASFGETPGHSAYSVEQTWEGGYVISGVANNGIVVHCPMIVRTDGSGGLIWQESFLYPSGYNRTYADESPDGGYFVAGMNDFRVIRLAPGLGIEDDVIDGSPLVLEAPLPNPFSTLVQLSYSIQAAGPVDAAVYGLSGELITELDCGMESAGPHSLTWGGADASGRPCPAGVYLVRISANSATDSRSVVLLR